MFLTGIQGSSVLEQNNAKGAEKDFGERLKDMYPKRNLHFFNRAFQLTPSFTACFSHLLNESHGQVFKMLLHQISQDEEVPSLGHTRFLSQCTKDSMAAFIA